MILFIDDSAEMRPFAEGLRIKHVKIDWAGNFYDARDSLAYEPGAKNYDAIILDLHMPTKGLPKDKETFQLANKVFSGWAFYKYVLDSYPILQKKTIFLTGVPENFKDRIGEEHFSELNVIQKGSNNVEDAYAMLKKLGVKDY